MKPTKQQPLIFENKCGCIVDYNLLESAMLWYANTPLIPFRKIYLHGLYAAVSIYNEKIHIHRLIMMYKSKVRLPPNLIVHHKDGNKLNNAIENLEITSNYRHASHHNKSKVLTIVHRNKISEANKRRKGLRHRRKRPEITPELVYNMRQEKLSFNRISLLLNMDWGCVKQRYNDFIHENPELLNEKQ